MVAKSTCHIITGTGKNKKVCGKPVTHRTTFYSANSDPEGDWEVCATHAKLVRKGMRLSTTLIKPSVHSHRIIDKKLGYLKKSK